MNQLDIRIAIHILAAYSIARFQSVGHLRWALQFFVSSESLLDETSGLVQPWGAIVGRKALSEKSSIESQA